MRVPTPLRSLRTSKKHALIAGAAGAAVLAAVLLFAGGPLFGAVGKGAGWMVDRAVRLVAYRNAAPAPEAGEARARVALARSPLERVKGTDRSAAGAEGEMGPPVPADRPATDAGEEVPAGPEAAPALENSLPAPEELSGLGLVTPLDEERFGDRNDEMPYRSFGLRDPMIPLVVPGKKDEGNGRFSIYGIGLVGLAWKDGRATALCEDKYRKTWLFREGDWTKDGARVVEITENSITFAQLRYGETSRHTLRLAAREGEN